MNTFNTYVNELCNSSKEASRIMRTAKKEKIDAALHAVAEALLSQANQIILANQIDIENAKTSGLSSAMIDRLTLNQSRIEAMAKGVQEIASFASPLGKTISYHITAQGLQVEKKSSPIGTILFIFESRPNVTIDGAALCLKSGNAVILRGGKESAHSNKILADIFIQSLSQNDLPEAAVQLVNHADREIVNLLLQKDDKIDVVIPRGGENLIRAVTEATKIPVIKHYKGVCHIYVDQTADLEKAEQVILNAKVQRPGVCNAMETLLLDRRLPADWIHKILNRYLESSVTLVGDAEVCEMNSQVALATQDDWEAEYLDLKLSIALVGDVNEAIQHVERYSSGHTEAILAEDEKIIDRFVDSLDSSSIMINASTRFADGGQYGLGAEVGISTDKLHARGPMGVESLTTYRWIVRGDGHVRS